MKAWKQTIFARGVFDPEQVPALTLLTLAEWVDEELAGHGMANSRNEETFFDVVRLLWTHLNLQQRNDLDVVLGSQIRRKVAAFLAGAGPQEGLRRELHALLECYAYLPLTLPSEAVQQGMRAPASETVTTGLWAPHSLRDAFARAWGAYTEREFLRLDLALFLPTGMTYTHEPLRGTLTGAQSEEARYNALRFKQHATACPKCRVRPPGVVFEVAQDCPEGQRIMQHALALDPSIKGLSLL